MANKRRHERIVPDENDPIEIQIMGSGFLDEINARDISISGIGILVPSAFEGCNIDEPVELIITLPRVRSFKAKGIIRHSNAQLTQKGIFGVEFTWIEPNHKDDIPQYIDKMKKNKP
jgi:c-di-GMP-binding flagellar brake protein YcgR